MPATALHFLLLTMSGWVNRQQLAAIAYLRDENRVLRVHLVATHLPLTEGQRPALAQKARPLGRKALGELACIATPDAILRWYRQLAAKKYDGTPRRKPGRPRKAVVMQELGLRMARRTALRALAASRAGRHAERPRLSRQRPRIREALELSIGVGVRWFTAST